MDTNAENEQEIPIIQPNVLLENVGTEKWHEFSERFYFTLIENTIDIAFWVVVTKSNDNILWTVYLFIDQKLIPVHVENAYIYTPDDLKSIIFSPKVAEETALGKAVRRLKIADYARKMGNNIEKSLQDAIRRGE